MPILPAISDLQNTIISIDQLLIHFKSQTQISKQDTVLLRQTIVHIDSLLVSLRSNHKPNDLVLHDLIGDLNNAVEHLRRVLVDAENTEYEHEEVEQQKRNDSLFSALIRQIKQLS